MKDKEEEENTPLITQEEAIETENNEIDQKQYVFIRDSYRRLAGLIMMGLSGLYYIVANSILQIVYSRSKDHVNSMSLVLARSIICTLFAIIFLCLGKVNPIQSWRNVFSQSVLGLSSFLSVLFLYMSIEKIPVGDATALQCMVPIFTTIMSILFLKQKSNYMDYICCFFGIVGLVIMTRPTLIFGEQETDSRELCKKVSNCKQDEVLFAQSGYDYVVGVAYALLSAFTIAMFFISVKALGRTGDFMIGVFFLGATGLIIPLVHHIIMGMTPQFGLDNKDWAIVFLASFLSYISIMFLAEALKLEDAGPASMIRYLDFVYAFILQFLFFGIKPTLFTIIGAIIIVTSTGTLTLYRHFSSQKKTSDSEKETSPDSGTEQNIDK